MFLTPTAPREQLEAVSVAHKKWVDDGVKAGIVLVGGRFIPPAGGFMIIRGQREAVEALVATEPFVARDVAEFRLQEINIPTTAPGLEALTNDDPTIAYRTQD